MDDPGESGRRFGFLVPTLSPSLPTAVFLIMAFLPFPDGVHLVSVDGEAQDQGQGEAEVKGSVSQKKAIATLKVSGGQGKGILLGFWTLVCHGGPGLSDLQQYPGGRV